MKKSGLEPIIDKNTKILILGSLPSDISIERQEYYANKSNDFWKILDFVFDENLEDKNYSDKITFLQKYQVGLWDIYHSAFREGSLDSNIKQSVLNEFHNISTNFPKIQMILLNGKEASKMNSFFLELGFVVVCLPSSSGANRKNNAKRLRLWRNAILSPSRLTPSLK